MSIKQAFRMAIKSLSSSKMRSFLTMLGIIIGVAAVIMIVSIVGGMSKDITDQFESLGTNLVNISIMGRNSNRSVSVDDMMAVAAANPDSIAAMTPSVSVSVTAKYDTENMTTTATGVNEYFGQIRNYEVAAGRFLEYIDVERRQMVCVIGSYVAEELFANENPLGESIKLNGQTFKVVGVLKEKSGEGKGSYDDVAIIPYTVATRLGRNGVVSSYMIQAVSTATTDEAVTVLKAKLYEVFANENAYRVFNQSAMVEQVASITKTMSLVLGGVAGISLLVGGIGIMNIMLVSVTERTKEIGIRKSLGARRRDIMSQFLIEAATTSATGGVVGIVFGYLGSYGIGKAFAMTVVYSPLAVLIAFGVSVGIGMIFGYFPANKAAKLHPIEALRQE